TAGRDVSGLRADGGDPFLRRLGEELRAVVGTNVLGNAAQDEQIRQYVDDVDRFEPAGHPNGQALTGELVDDVEQAKFASVMSALLEEVVGPDVVGALGPQPDAGSVTGITISISYRLYDSATPALSRVADERDSRIA